ncbi:MAG: C39 family peptidase [Luteolibacter sp.]
MFSGKKSAYLLCFFFTASAALAADKIPCPLDSLLEAPGSWQMTPDQFEKEFSAGKNSLVTWLTKDRTRAKLGRKKYRDAVIDLKIFGGEVPVEEAIVDFADGRLNMVSVSIYNRGDGGKISKEDFTSYFTAAGKAMGTKVGSKPRRKDADPNSGLLTAGYSWYSQQNGTALLEHNDKAMEGGDLEFLRLRFARPNAKGALATSMSHSRGGAAARLGDLPPNVVESNDGDVFVSNVPMVDQGDKGYCVVATTQRVFEYYGIGADMHQIAQISDADPDSGTNPLKMAKELDKIDYRFNTRLEIIGLGKPFTEVIEKKGEYYVGKPVDQKKFLKEIKSYVDDGLPLLWGLQLGLFPERPNLNPQTAGGHMRLIIGYNENDDDIIFSDSWGAGHEQKKMKMSDAYKATNGLFVLKPTVH